MDLQEHIRTVLREEVGLMGKIKNFFTKKDNTPNADDKVINTIVKFINGFLELEEDQVVYGSKVRSYVYRDSTGKTVMEFIPHFKRLEYTNDFARNIYDFIPDERLLDEDSELMRRVFEKLTKHSVNKAQNFNNVRV